MQYFQQVNQQTERYEFDLSGGDQILEATQNARSEGMSALQSLSTENIGLAVDIAQVFSGMTNEMAAAASTVKSLGTRADLFPVDRDGLIQEAVNRGESGVNENASKLETLLLLADADLYTQSMPPRSESFEGRSEARSEILAALQLSDNKPGMLRKLALKDNDVAAEILSSYGETILDAVGGDITHSELKKMAETFALQSKDEGRRKAAEARRSLGKLGAVAKAYQNQVWSAYRKELSGENRRDRIQAVEGRAAEARTPTPKSMPAKKK